MYGFLTNNETNKVSMEVPRFWRIENYLLNPNKNGFRPVCPVSKIVIKTEPINITNEMDTLNKGVVIYQSPTK